MEKDYIKNAYDIISKDYNAGSIDDFKLSLAKPEGMKKVYDYLSQDYNVGDFEYFQSKLSGASAGTSQVKQDSYLGDLGERAVAGSANIVGSSTNLLRKAASTIEDAVGDNQYVKAGVKTVASLIPGVSSLMAVSDISGKKPSELAGVTSEYFNELGDKFHDRSDRYQGKDFMQLAKEGDWSGALGEIFLSATESLPYSLAIAGSGGSGLIGTGLVTASDKYDQLMDQKPDMNKALAFANATVTGISEAATECLGAGALGKTIRNIMAKGGKEVTGRAIEKSIRDRAAKIMEKHWIVGPIAEEGIEEMVNAATEYAMDYLTGVERPDGIGEAVMKAGVYGAAGGSQYTPVIAGHKYLASRRRKKITTRFNDSQSEASKLLGDDFAQFDNSLDGLSLEQKADFIQQVGNVKKLNPEQRSTLFDYVNNRNQYTQYVDYVKSQITEEQERAKAEIDRVSNPDMEAVISVKSNLSEEPVNIVGGKIVFDEEGLVDVDNSDKTIYYIDESGKRQMATPDKFASLIDNAPLSRLYADMMREVQERVIRQEEEIAEGMDIDGVVDPGVLEIGMDVVLPDGKQGMIQQFDEEGKAIVVTDGGSFSYPVDKLSKMENVVEPNKDIIPEGEVTPQPQFPLKKDGTVDYKAMTPQQRFEYTRTNETPESAIEDLTLDIASKQKELEKLNEKLSSATGGDRLEVRDKLRSLSTELKDLEGFYNTVVPAEEVVEEEIPEAEQQPVAVPGSESSIIPIDGKGDPIYHQAPVEATLGELLDGTLEPEEVDVFVSNQRQVAEKALNKARNYQPKMGTSKAKYLSEKKAAQDKVNEAQAIVDYWGTVENSIKESRIKPGDDIANEIKAVGEPLSGEELAAMMLANGSIKLTKDSYKKETGFSDEDAKKMFGLFSSSGNEGVNLERAGELLMLADQENGTNFFDQEDANAGRNAIINVLSSSRTKGDLSSYIRSNREAMAERERQAEYNAYSEWCEEMFHMSPKEYEAYEEQVMRDIVEKNISNEEYGDFMSNLVDEQKAIENESDQGNEQPGVDSVLEGGGEVLPREESIQVGRDGGIEEGPSQVDGRLSIEDGVTQQSESSGVISFDEAIDRIFSGESEGLSQKFFDIAKTPSFMKEYGISGDKFTLSYGTISRHIKKDPNHTLNAEIWKRLPDAIQDPFAITSYKDGKKDGFRIYTNIEVNGSFVVAGVDVKTIGKNIEVNSVSTVFGKEKPITNKEIVIFRSEKITPQQESLLTKPNSLSYFPSEELSSTDKDSKLISENQTNDNKSFVAPSIMKGETPLDYASRISDSKNLFNEEQSVNTDPTDAQKEAGNYKKGHVKINGFDITIEQPAGSVRSGKDADGKEWSVTMNNTYGYIRGTEGVDGDHIDVFIGPDIKSDMAYVVDQVNPDGSFDEHMAMIGFGSIEEAQSAYLANYEEGWQGLGNITGIPMDGFKKWIDSSTRKTKPFSDYGIAKEKTVPGKNRLVTDERYEELRRRMREKLGGQMNIGVDPEILAIGTEMAVYHIEKGACRFTDYAKGMINDLGDSIRPYLKAFYNGARDLPEMAGLSKEMDPYEEVSRFDVANMDKPVKDMQATIAVMAKEQETEKQVGEVKKKQSSGKKGKDKSVSSQGNDLFNQNSNKHEIQRRDGRKTPSVRAEQLHGIVGQTEGNQGQDLPVGRQSRKEVDGRDTGGDTGGVHGSNGVDTEGSRGLPELSGHQLNKANRNRNNYSFGESHIDVPSGEIAKLKANIEAVRVLKEIERNGHPATEEQKLSLSRYVGWGGLANALDESKYAARERYSRDWGWNEKYLPYHERLRELLSPEEFRSAVQSTTTSHYTPETVIKSLWKITGRFGFKGGEISEPAMGVGHIIGMMPKDISSSSNVSGFEIDDLSGRIGKVLYPDANVKVQGYESEFSPKSKDLTITNVPFGKDAPYDKFLDKTLRKKLGGAYNLHNYFIAKGLLELKEGGLGVFVTSSSTMDGADGRFREFIQGNGFDLVGAIRLPNDTFQKNAGTSVTADILMFHRRKAGEVSNGINFVSTTSVGEGSYKENGEIRNKPIMVNEYFSGHPEMMLGEMMTAYDAGSGGLYSGASQTLRGRSGEALDTALDTVINQLPENILEKTAPVVDNGLKEQTVLKDGTLSVKNGKVYLSMGGTLEPIETKGSFTFNGKERRTAGAINAYNELKDTLKRLISAEQSVEMDPEPIRKELNRRYDNFVQSYGTLNRNKYLDNILAEDFEHNLPLSLENISKEPSPTGKSFIYKVTKGKGILDKRISFPVSEPIKADSVQDAVNISRSYRGAIDIPFIARLVDKTEMEVMDDMLRGGLAYKDPVTGTLVDRGEYLSGNVREKLDQAKAVAGTNLDYEKNVEYLTNVQPEVVRFGDISYRLGTTWIPSGFLDKFAEDVLGISDCGVRFIPVLNEFVLDKSGHISDYAKSGTYKTDYLGAISLFETALNQRKPKVYDEQTVNDPHTGESRKVRVVNEVETQAATEKISEISDKFIEYIDSHKAIHKELERIYNDKYNNFRLREYDLPSFSYLGTNKDGEEEVITHYPNSNQDISLREHQAKAVQRGLAESTLLAHQVGTGKTFTMITTAMEMRRLGIARKPMIVVQNATLEDFVKDFYKLYPGANVLAPGKDERSSENRKRLFNLIATGDFDAIVIPQSFMQFIPDDEGRKKALIQRRIEEYERVIESTEDDNLKRRLQKEVENLQDEFEGNTQGKKKRSVKDKAKAENRIKSKMERQLDRRTDDVLTFEQMGIDALFIDEAHNFKKIGFASKMNNVKGIDTGASQRANSLLLKSKWIQEKNNGRNVVLATGTPITNTMAEVWTMMNFVSPDILEAYDIKSFDEFATTFGMVEPSLEFTATGNFKIMDRFKSYVNVPELIKAFRSHADVVLTEDVKEFKKGNSIPRLRDDNMTNIVIDKNEDLQDVMQVLVDKLEKYNEMSGREKREMSALPLVVFTKAKQAAIDLRLLNPSFPDNPNSKTNQVVSNVTRLYNESDQEKGAQLIFCDSYQSPADRPQMDLFGYDPAIPRFNLYEDIKGKLIGQGIPAKEIAIVNEYDGDRRKSLFEKVRNGDVRILIGSTEKMGVGVNVQDRLYALHHIDAPLRPMDFEQRNGRILRQGNNYALWDKPVNVLTYGVQGTLDATAYDRLRIKQDFINQMMKGDVSGRVMEEHDDEDPSGMTFQQMAATLSGDKTAQLLFVAENKLKKLRNLKRGDANSKSGMAETIEYARKRNMSLNDRRKNLERMHDVISERFPEGVENMIANRSRITDKFSVALDPIINSYDEAYSLNRGTKPLKISLNDGKAEVIVHFDEGRMVYDLYVGDEHIVENRQFNGGKGLMSSIDHQLKAVSNSLSDVNGDILENERKIEGLTKAMSAPWGREEELRAAEQEVIGLKNQLEEKARVNDSKSGGKTGTASLDVDGTILPEGNIRFRSREKITERFDKLRNSTPVEITGEEYKGKYDLDRSSAQRYILDNLRGEYLIRDTGETVTISKRGAKKVTSHSQGSEAHLKSIIAIPQIIENSIFMEERPAYKKGAQYDSYRYYVTGLRIKDEDYTVRMTVGVKDGEFYYDHYLSYIEKGKLLDLLFEVNRKESLNGFIPTEDVPDPSYAISKDKMLLSILQIDKAKNEEVITEVKSLAKSLNTEINIVHNLDEIPDDNSDLQRRKQEAKGWYNEDTGEIYLILPNAESVGDAQATVLHELVGHKGLRGLLGGKFDNMMDTVYQNLPEETRKDIAHSAVHDYNLDVRVATEEYLASIAENGVRDPGVWNSVKSAIKEFFRSIGLRLRITDEDIAYMLWKSKNRLLKTDNIIDVAKKIADDYNMRQDLLFRDAPDGALLSRNRKDRAIMVDTVRTIREKWDSSSPVIRKFYERFREGYQDGMLALKRFQEDIGEEIQDFENAYLNQNTIISRSNYEIDHFKEDLLEPITNMMKSLGGIRKAETYLMVRHGLERNAKMRQAAIEKKRISLEGVYEKYKMELEEGLQDMIGSGRYSQKEIDKLSLYNDKRLEERKKSNEETLEKMRIKQSSMDYSGLTDISEELFEADRMDEQALKEFADQFEGEHSTADLWSLVRKANKASVNKLFESGYISKEEANRINSMYEYYIPLRGWDQTTASDLYDYFFKDEKDTVNAPIKKAKGRKSRAGSVLANIGSMYESAVFIGNKNKMKQRFLNLVRNHPSEKATISGQWFQNTGTEENPEWNAVLPERLTDDSEINADILDEFENKMNDLKEKGLAKTSREFLKLGVPVKSWQADQHAIRVKEAGRDIIVYINGDPRVAQVINGLSNQTVEIKILRLVDGIKRFMMKNYTTRSVNFIARNLIRDMIYVNTMNVVKYGAKYEMDFIKNILPCHKAIYRSLRGKTPRTAEERRMADMYEEFKRNGGQTGFVALRGYDRYKSDIEQAIKNSERGKYTMGNLFHTMGAFIEATNTLMEDTSRFSVYATSKQKGKSISQSVSDAKEASVNFNRKGSGAMGAAYANSFYFFFNAGMQGTHNFFSAAKHHPGRAAAAIGMWGALGFTMSLLASAFGDDDDDYNTLPDYVRQSNLILPIFGTSKYILLPLPVELRTIFGCGDMLAQYLKGEYRGRSFALDIAGKLMDILPHNFIGEGTDSILQNVLPDASRPVFDAYWFNKNYFGKRVTGRNEYNEHKPEFHKVISGTSKVLIKASEKLNELTGGDYATKGWADGFLTNPSAAEYIFSQFMGGVGNAITQTYKTVEGIADKDVQLRNIPVVSGLSYDMENAVPRNYINERYQSYMDLIDKVNTLDKLYMKGLMDGRNLFDNLKLLKYSKDSQVANIAEMYKSQIEGMYAIAENLADEEKKAMFARIRELKRQMLDEIDEIK